MAEWKEAEITVNGARLTVGQSMTVRVALECFAADLEEGLGDDETGKGICDGYKQAIREIRKRLYRPKGE